MRNYVELCNKYFPYLEVKEDFSNGIHSDISLDVRSEMSQKDLQIIEQEEQEYFSNSRDNTCYGGSDIATIFGKGFYPPSVLARKKQGMILDTGDKELFATGHRAETPIRHSFERESGLRTIEWPITMVNPKKAPHFRMNIDGIVFENGRPGIYEGKWASPYGDAIKNYKEMRRLLDHGVMPGIELCPEKYLFQVWGYMAGMDVDFGYLCGGWGYSDKQIGYVRIPRLPKDKEEYMLQTCEEFINLVNRGGIPSDEIFSDKSKLLETYKEIAHEIPHEDKIKVLDPDDRQKVKRFVDLQRQTKELEALLQEDLKTFEEMWIKERGLDKLKEEEEALQAGLQEALMESTIGSFEEGGTIYTVSYKDTEGKLSFDKELCQEKYPEIYDEVYYRPKKRSFTCTAEKKKKGRVKR